MSFKKCLPLLIIFIIFFGFMYFHLYKFLTLESLQEHRQFLLQWTKEHYVLAVCIYILLYVMAVATLFPGLVIFTLAGGFLFGTCLGACYALFSDMLGAIFIFMAVKLAFSDWFRQKSGKWLLQMEQGFSKNALNYLFVLRLMPFFPFSIVNIASALLGIRLWIFIVATFFGIIPSSLIYTSVGHSLGVLFKTGQVPNLDLVFQPHVFLPLMALALLAILPVAYRRFC